MELEKALEELKKIALKNNNTIDEALISKYISEFDFDAAIDFLDKEGIEILATDEDLSQTKLENDYEKIINANDIVKIYFNEIGNYKLLSYEEETELFKIYNEGLIAKE